MKRLCVLLKEHQQHCLSHQTRRRSVLSNNYWPTPMTTTATATTMRTQQFATSTNNTTPATTLAEHQQQKPGSSLPDGMLLDFAVLSTFRHKKTGEPLRPRGLQWNLPGTSHVTYVLSSSSSSSPEDHENISSKNSNNNKINNQQVHPINVHDKLVHQSLVRTHNRWAFARGDPFVAVDDIAQVSLISGGGGDDDDTATATARNDNNNDAGGGGNESSHKAAAAAAAATAAAQIVMVEWKDTVEKRLFKEERSGTDLVELIKTDKAATTTTPAKGDGEAASPNNAAQVWINGHHVGDLNGPETVEPILEALSSVTGSSSPRRLAFKRSEDGRFLRIERYFGGMLRRKDDVFDHIMDNLIAMEDVTMLDSNTLIGSATLQDWIMGGNLTSRMWVRQVDDRIRFLRPLHNDDIQTSDRKFELVKGTDDEKMALVEKELKRLRELAEYKHPFDDDKEENAVTAEEDPLDEVRRRLRANRPRRKFFGM